MRLLRVAVPGWVGRARTPGVLSDSLLHLLTDPLLLKWEGRLVVLVASAVSPKVAFSQGALTCRLKTGDFVQAIVLHGAPRPPRAVDVLWDCKAHWDGGEREGEAALHRILESRYAKLNPPIICYPNL